MIKEHLACLIIRLGITQAEAAAIIGEIAVTRVASWGDEK